MEKKIAQDFGTGNWLKEKLNVVEWGREKFSKEFRQYMDNLRQTDSLVRVKAKTLKDNLKSANTLFKRREYVSFFIPLTTYYNTNKEIHESLEKLNNDLLTDRYKMLSSKLVEEDVKLLKTLEESLHKIKQKKNEAKKNEAKKNASNDVDTLIKTAGVFSNMANFLKRHWALQGLERQHKKFFEQLRKDGKSLLDEAEKLHQNAILNFKKMAKSRAGREIAEYLEAVADYRKNFESFEMSFIKFYDTYMSKVLETIKETERIEAEKLADEEARKNFNAGIYDSGTAPIGDGTSLPNVLEYTNPHIEDKKTMSVPDLDLTSLKDLSKRKEYVEDILDKKKESDEEYLGTPLYINPGLIKNIEKQVDKFEKEVEKTENKTQPQKQQAHSKAKNAPQASNQPSGKKQQAPSPSKTKGKEKNQPTKSKEQLDQQKEAPQNKQQPQSQKIVEKADELSEEDEILKDIARMIGEPSKKEEISPIGNLEALMGPKPSRPPGKVPALQLRKSHEDFMNKIIVMAESSNTKDLVKEILSYAESIDEEDTETSLKLISIVEGLL